MIDYFWFETAVITLSMIISSSMLITALGTGWRRRMNLAFALFIGMSVFWSAASILLRYSLPLGAFSSNPPSQNPQIWVEFTAFFLIFMGVLSLRFSAIYLDKHTRKIDIATGIGVAMASLFSVFVLFPGKGFLLPEISETGIVNEQITNLGSLGILITMPFFIGSLLLFLHEKKKDKPITLGFTILIVGMLMGGMNFQFPFMSVGNLISMTLFGYAVINKQLFNPLREQNIQLIKEMKVRGEAEDALRRSKNNLRRSEERFRTLIENSFSGIVVIKPDGSLKYSSPSNYKVLGIRLGTEAIGGFFNRVHPEDLPRITDDFKRVIEKPGLTVSETYRFMHKDGSWRFLEMESKNLTRDPSVGGVVLNFRDVTEHMQTEKDLRKAHERLEDAFEKLQELDKMRSDFIDMAAHEIRTPLSAVKTYTDLMKDEKIGTFTLEEKEYINEMESNISSLNNLVTEMLDYTKSGSIPLNISTEKENFTAIVEDTAEEFRHILEIHDISFDIQGEGNMDAQFDVEMIKKVIRNMISNAIKYSQDGGEVSIALKEVERNIEFSIQDKGVGIHKKDQPYIFERFYMGDTSLTREKDRMGMGLPIAKSIVERHGGRIWLNSQVGQGSTFYFTLPRQIGE